MNKDTLKFIIVLAGLFFLPACVRISSSSQKETKENIVASETDGPVEFVFTKEELAAINKWEKNSNPFDTMVKDAIGGDKAALYVLGMSYLAGMPTINVEEADRYLSQSASFGFGPALYQIFQTYLEKKNILLSFAYLNLIIAAGHSEFVMSYHKTRNGIVEELGPDVFNEIERIAQHKWKNILKNQQDFANVIDDEHKFIFLHTTMVNVMDEDILFDSNYWQKVQAGTAPDNLEKWLHENFLLIVNKRLEKSKKRLKAYQQMEAIMKKELKKQEVWSKKH
jgi:hypothetical protein